jgi:alpha-1,2-glucosyltransferase
MNENKLILIFICMFFIGIIGFMLIKNQDMYSDELPHSTQIRWLNNEKYEILPYLTVLPGYHFIISTFLGSNDSIQIMRFWSLLLILLLLSFIFHNLTNDKIKLLQMFFFPCIFVYFFVLYTDIFSLIFVLLAYYYFTKQKYYVSAILCFISILIRQNNVIWIGMFICMLYIQKYDFKIKKFNEYKIFIKDIFLYIFFIIITLLFFIIRKGQMVMGDTTNHPLSFHMGNIWFILFMLPFLFWPIFCSRIKNMILILKNYKNIFLLIGIMLIGLGTFVNNHVYNQHNAFFRNKILLFATSTPLNEIIFFIFVILGILFLMSYKFDKTEYYLLYIFSFIFLSISWLIEIRYSIIFLTFFMIFRQKEKNNIEILQLIYNIILSIIFFIGMITWKFFW